MDCGRRVSAPRDPLPFPARGEGRRLLDPPARDPPRFGRRGSRCAAIAVCDTPRMNVSSSSKPSVRSAISPRCVASCGSGARQSSPASRRACAIRNEGTLPGGSPPARTYARARQTSSPRSSREHPPSTASILLHHRRRHCSPTTRALSSTNERERVAAWTRPRGRVRGFRCSAEPRSSAGAAPRAIGSHRHGSGGDQTSWRAGLAGRTGLEPGGGGRKLARSLGFPRGESWIRCGSSPPDDELGPGGALGSLWKGPIHSWGRPLPYTRTFAR
jgi:hypothetical protein